MSSSSQVILQHPWGVDIIIFLLHLGKLRLREVTGSSGKLCYTHTHIKVIKIMLLRLHANCCGDYKDSMLFALPTSLGRRNLYVWHYYKIRQPLLQRGEIPGEGEERNQERFTERDLVNQDCEGNKRSGGRVCDSWVPCYVRALYMVTPCTLLILTFLSILVPSFR